MGSVKSLIVENYIIFSLSEREDSLNFKTKQVKWFASYLTLGLNNQLDQAETWKEILNPVAVERPKNASQEERWAMRLPI